MRRKRRSNGTDDHRRDVEARDWESESAGNSVGDEEAVDADTNEETHPCGWGTEMNRGFWPGFMAVGIVCMLIGIGLSLDARTHGAVRAHKAYELAKTECDSTITVITAGHLEELEAMRGTIEMFRAELTVAENQKLLDDARIQELKDELGWVK
jgi:hypothetical protein